MKQSSQHTQENIYEEINPEPIYEELQNAPVYEPVKPKSILYQPSDTVQFSEDISPNEQEDPIYEEIRTESFYDQHHDSAISADELVENAPVYEPVKPKSILYTPSSTVKFAEDVGPVEEEPIY